MVSEHASPLAALGEADAGGQNVHVAELALGLARLGHEVQVYTRRDDAALPERVAVAPGVCVVHVPVGPPRTVPKDDLLPHMDAFADWMAEDWQRTGDPDVVHAHFWMSGLAALRAGRSRGVPVAQTFHALGSVKRRHQRESDTSPPERLELERWIAREADAVIATCRDEVEELADMGVRTAHVHVVPCGVDTAHFSPSGPAWDHGLPGGRRARLLAVGRLVERKGFDLAVRALPDLPDAELVVVGGPPVERLDADPEARRLRALAEELGVGDRLVLPGSGHTRPCRPSTAPPTSCSRCRGTSRSASRPSRPRRAAVPSSAARSEVCSTPWRTASPAASSPPRDVEALVSAVRGLLADPDGAARMGRRARARAVELFDWSVVAARTEGVLEMTAARPVPDRGRGVATGRGEPRPSWLHEHAAEVDGGMRSLLGQSDRIRSWGEQLATTLVDGGRLLAAGNGGSAAEAQHLTAELVGRCFTDRRPLSAHRPVRGDLEPHRDPQRLRARRGVRPAGRGARPPG